MTSLRASLKPRLRHYRVEAVAFALTLFGRSVTTLRPVDRWYWDVRFVARLIVRLVHRLRPGLVDPSLEARLIHRFLDLLAESGRHFPIPTRIEGLELFQAMAATQEGFVCCTAHVPLVKLLIPVARQHLHPGAELMLAVKFADETGSFKIWNDEPIRCIETGPRILLQTRSLLRRGGCLLLLTDKEQGEYLSSNIFRFVGKVKSKVIMGFPQLLPDGVILLRVLAAPAPECLDESQIRANLDFIAENVRAILAGDRPADQVRSSVLPLAQVAAAERGRETDRIQLYTLHQLKTRAGRLETLLADESIQVADRALYERRLKLMQDELQLRSRVLTRAEFGQDGKPIVQA